MTELEELTGLYNLVKDCCLHEPVFTPEDVAEVLAWAGDHASRPESESIVVVSLKDRGGYGLFTQGEDYTGHGCQCGSATFRNAKLGNLLTALDNWDLEKLLKGDREDG